MKLHICTNCGEQHQVDEVDLFSLENKFKYINCSCGVSQVNPFKLNLYNAKYKAPYTPYIDVNSIQIDLSKLELKTKL